MSCVSDKHNLAPVPGVEPGNPECRPAEEFICYFNAARYGVKYALEPLLSLRSNGISVNRLFRLVLCLRREPVQPSARFIGEGYGEESVTAKDCHCLWHGQDIDVWNVACGENPVDERLTGVLGLDRVGVENVLSHFGVNSIRSNEEVALCCRAVLEACFDFAVGFDD